MNIADIKRALVRVDDVEFGSGAEPQEVRRAEDRLSVTLPSNYVAFVMEFGWLCVGHTEINGIGRDVPMHLELIRNTSRERNSGSAAIPHYLIPVVNDGGGNHYCLDLTRSDGNDCPIVFWSHELGGYQDPADTSDSFLQWLYDKVHEPANQ